MLDIIPENPTRHADRIEALYDVTFGPGHFAKTAERLREFNRSLPDLNRIAIDPTGRVVGAVRMWPILIERGGPAVFVGPVAVHPDARGKKLGLDLCRHALEAAREADWPAAIIIGSRSYFSELGFVPVDEGQLGFPGPQDMERVMRMDLAGDSSLYSGTIIPHRIYSSGGQFAKAQFRV